MLEILIPNRVKAETNKRYGEVYSPCLPTPVLETPWALPQSIKVVRDTGLRYENTNNCVKDQRLTDLFKSYTDGIFSVLIEDAQLYDGSIIPVANTFNDGSQFAIGPRLELLEKYHGIGSELIDLLSRSPAWIMTPEYIDEYLVDMYEHLGRVGDKDKKKRRTGLLPSFAHKHKVFSEVPKGLPYNLSKLIEDCLPRALSQSFLAATSEGEEVGYWPIATCSWYGFEPMLNKTMEMFVCQQQYDAQHRLEVLEGNPDMGQASDPTWMVLDDMIIYQQEHLYSTCIPPCHNATEIEDTLYSVGPFARLLKYLSHDRLN
jgi:hypothetical protein